MIYLIDNNGITDPQINLALEEYCLRDFPSNRSYFMVYVNRPSVIIGRHQNILAEVDLRFAQQTGLKVVRRISGGGAVYHDLGNLNFSFILPYNRRSLANLPLTLAPIRATLLAMGVPAAFNYKNDLFIAGRKISGNAQFSNTKRIMVHGTLLFDSNLDHLRQALNPQADHIASNARKSVKSEVTNILPYLTTRFSLKEFRRRMLDTVTGQYGGMQTVRLENNEWQAIEQLSEEKYCNWGWNYGRAPAFQINRLTHNANGRLGYSMDVDSGCIAAIRFEPECIGLVGRVKIEDHLVGVPFRRDAISARLNELDAKTFGRRFTADQVVALLAADLVQADKPVLQTPHRELL